MERSRVHNHYRADHSSRYRKSPPKPQERYTKPRQEPQTPTQSAGFGMRELFLMQVTICAILAMGLLVISIADPDLSYFIRDNISVALEREGEFSLPSGATYITHTSNDDEAVLTLPTEINIETGDFIIDENILREINQENTQ